MFRLTPVVKNLIFICVGVFILQKIFPGLYITERLALWKLGTENFRPYQLFTYMFAHGSVGHLFFNILTFAFMGAQLEMIWGFKRFLMYFLITGIGASIFYVLIEFFLDPAGMGLMVGASGAIYGMLMAYGFLYPDVEIQLLIPPIPVKAKYLVIVLGVFAYLLDSSGQVAHLAHIGGAIVGFLVLRLGLLRD
jgi:membrane associated rhomboid family serine protease